MNAPAKIHFTRKQRLEAGKLEKRLCRLVGEAIGDYDMIRAGDRVMVCLSGGKDSYGLLEVLSKLRERSPVSFDLIVVNLDQRHPGYPERVLPDYLDSLGIPYRIEVQDTYSVVKRVVPEGETMCGLCSRLRRGVLYRVAREVGATKIALGHHRDDILETFFLNLFFGGKMKAMSPKLQSDDGNHVVIRPLAYVAEKDLEAYAQVKGFPIIPCDLCGSQPTLQRKQVKEMLRAWEKRHPGRVESMFRALSDLVPSHLMDRKGCDFAAVVGGVAAQDWRSASREPVGLAPDPASARDAIIQVYAARVIGWRGVFGVHTWIAVKPAVAGEYTVYEVIGWRLRSQDTALVVRHRAPDMRWFGSAPELVAEKRGAGVEELIERLDKAAHSYPWAGEYTMWPGPNSNTFTAWVLRAVPELEADLPPTAIGKDYSALKLVGSAPSARRFHFSFFGLAGLTASAVEGFEVNLLGLSFGINPFDPSLKLPLVGRVGPARSFASKADEAAAHKHAL